MIYNRFPLIKEFISRDDLFAVLHAVVFSVPCLPYDFFFFFVDISSIKRQFFLFSVLLYSEIKCRINNGMWNSSYIFYIWDYNQKIEL